MYSNFLQYEEKSSFKKSWHFILITFFKNYRAFGKISDICIAIQKDLLFVPYSQKNLCISQLTVSGLRKMSLLSPRSTYW